MHGDIYRRLVNAKYVLRRAGIAQREAHEMSQAVCVLLLHDAIEILMVAVLDHLGVTASTNRQFMDFWGLLKQNGHPDAPDKAAMDALNTIRVGLKHKGVIPNPREVRDLITRAQGFFENVLTLYCGLKFSDISLIDLVADLSIREMLSKATEKFDNGNKNHAMVDLRRTLDKVRSPRDRRIPGVLPPRMPHMDGALRSGGWERYLDALHNYLRANATITNILMLGVDPVRFFDFNNSVPSVQYTMGKTYHVTYGLDYANCSKERFEELIEFVIEYAVK